MDPALREPTAAADSMSADTLSEGSAGTTGAIDPTTFWSPTPIRVLKERGLSEEMIENVQLMRCPPVQRGAKGALEGGAATEGQEHR